MTTSHPNPSLQKELSVFCKKNNAKALALFSVDFSIVATCLYFVIFGDISLSARVLFSILAGLKLTGLATLAHDMAHNSFTTHKGLNKFLAVLCFVPCFYNYSLWKKDHHKLHHPKTNGPVVDSFLPLSLQDYQKLSPFKQLKYRVSRSGNPLGLAFYYIFERWSQVKVYPFKSLYSDTASRKSALIHFAIVVAYVCGIFVMAVSQSSSVTDGLIKVFLSLVLPFLIFQAMMGWALFVNHTHPSIPWFDKFPVPVTDGHRLTVYFKMPAVLEWASHYFMVHTVHHLNPAIPCYNLSKAQSRLKQLDPDHIVESNMLSADYFNTVKKCKLYDYQNHVWTNFKGEITAHTFLSTK